MLIRTDTQYKILGFNPGIASAFRQKLLALGLLPGSSFKVVRVAPFGDPLQVESGRVNLMLRKQDLAYLELTASVSETE